MPALGTTMPVTGAPCWVSLVTPDPHAARSFYAQVMGWEFLDSSLGSDFSLAVADGEPVAGLGYCHDSGLASRWTPYFAVADADETADRVRERGATLAVGPARLGEGVPPSPQTATEPLSASGRGRPSPGRWDRAARPLVWIS